MEQLLIHNVSRLPGRRMQRVARPTHRTAGIFLPGDLRVLPARALTVQEDYVKRNLSRLMELNKQGIIEVTTLSRRVVDLSTLQPAEVAPSPPLPAFPMDSLARDNMPVGQTLSVDPPPPEDFILPVAPNDISIEKPLPVPEDVPIPVLAAPKPFNRRK